MAEFRTFNTAIEGQPLIAATNGLDIRALEFTNFLKQLPPMTGTQTYSDQSRLYVNDLVQASVGHYLVNATGYLYLGPDTPEQASNYHALFNLRENSDVRVLDFVKVSGTTGYLANDDGTANCVTVQNVGFAPAGEAMLFGGPAPTGTNRLVLLQRTSPTGVNFTILPGCCSDLPVVN